MGIKSSFNKFLKEMCPQVFEEIHLSEYAYKKISIDISLYLHKYKAMYQDNWHIAFIKLIAGLRRNEIHCVFIYDGKSPPEKALEQSKRRDDKEKSKKRLFELEEAFEEYTRTNIIPDCLISLYKSRKSPKRLLSNKSNSVDMKWVEDKITQRRKQMYDISPEDFEDTKVLFDILNVPYYTAPWEAEKMCSGLCLNGLVDAVLSEDTDVMAYGVQAFLSKISIGSDTVTRIQSDSLLEGLDLTREQFLDFCIMCGTDYNPNIPRVGSKTAYKRIVQHGGIEQISAETVLDTSVLNHVRGRELFTEFEDYGLDKIPFCGHPDIQRLEQYMSERNIQLDMSRLISDFTESRIVFED